jgi:hypothetical protein
VSLRRMAIFSAAARFSNTALISMFEGKVTLLHAKIIGRRIA